MGYESSPDKYFKNSNLHIFPSISESFGLVLTESKIFGIPNILMGLDYISNSKGGTIIIYDDTPESIGKESIKILKNNEYMKNLGREARKSVRQFKNNLLLNRWIKLILSIYNGDDHYINLINNDKKKTQSEIFHILNNQLNLLKLRNKKFINFTMINLENFTFLENFE